MIICGLTSDCKPLSLYRVEKMQICSLLLYFMLLGEGRSGVMSFLVGTIDVP